MNPVWEENAWFYYSKHKNRLFFPPKFGFFEFSPYRPQLILEITNPEKKPFEASGARHSKFAGARKTQNDTRAKMQWLTFEG